jgi:aryl-alcohol dehydrogenase-like predicted oxidoreductase
MRYGKVPGVELPLSRLVLGTMIIHDSRQRASNYLLDAAVAEGFNTFDCAAVYGGGGSERGLGHWLAKRGNRDQVVILTKGCHHNADRQRVTPYDLLADFHDSLARLQTDSIDIYLLHRDDPAAPVGPIIETFNELRSAGKVRVFGGSNWSHQRLAEANAYAAAHELTPMGVSSPNFSLAEQVKDPWGPGCVGIGGPAGAAARAWYQANQMPVFAYSSLGRGFFSGRVTRANFAKGTAPIDGAGRTAYCHEVNFQRLDRVRQLAREKGLSVAQIATAWLTHQPLNVYPLVGAASRRELRDGVAGAEVELTEQEVAWLDLR